MVMIKHTMTRHDFLARLHDALRPKVYLEIGVQHGYSLNLAHRAEVAIGIDPNPLVAPFGNQVIHSITSDEFFSEPRQDLQIDLAFIDGMHLFEYALRDFINVEDYSSPGETVIVFDDVLPRNQGEASRIQCPGDWTGDVWKIHYALKEDRPDLELTLVDTQPTGLLIVRMTEDHHPGVPLQYEEYEMVDRLMGGDTVPDEVLDRMWALTPQEALERITA